MSSSAPTSINPIIAASPPGVTETQFVDAFELTRDEIAQVPAHTFIQISMDIPAAVITALGSIPNMQKHRPQIVRELPAFDISTLDRLETFALAAGQAHARHALASAPPEDVAELVEELTDLRELLVLDVSALAKRKLLDGDRLKKLNGPQGYKNVGFDVISLCAMLRENWNTVSGRTGLQMTEIQHAEGLAKRLAKALGAREQGPNERIETAETRQKAFTLFFRAYEQVRRAITYLRWDEDDADRIAPSLYAGRGSRKKSEVEPEPPAPEAPQNAPAPSPSPATPVTPMAADPNAAPGMPFNDPFGRR